MGRVMDDRAFRDCLGRFATGVTVVTCDVDGEPHGATVNAFTAVSLDPPLVLASLARQAKACRHLSGRPFTVNVLRADQAEIALRFAGRSTEGTVRWERPEPGLPPRLSGCLASIACRPWAEHEAGDHGLFLGEVVRIEHSEDEPLIFFRGAFRELGPSRATGSWLESADNPGISWFPLSA